MNGASMNGHADEQPEGLRIPEHLLQEVVTASHVTGTPRSTGLFDYISRSAATILQVRTACYAWGALEVINIL